MNNFIKIIFILLAFNGSGAVAHIPEKGKVTALFGPFLYRTNFASTPTGFESPLLGGFGLIAEGDTNPNGGLEIAMIYQHKLYFRQHQGKAIAEKTKIMYITMGYRHWFTTHFSTALAFFSSYSMGDPAIVHNEFTAGLSPKTSARDTTEYGFDLSLQWEIWGKDKHAVVLDTRYSRSVTTKDHEDADHYGALLGWRYQVQEK